jgi:hypothetical protein
LKSSVGGGRKVGLKKKNSNLEELLQIFLDKNLETDIFRSERARKLFERVIAENFLTIKRVEYENFLGKSNLSTLEEVKRECRPRRKG